LFLQTKHIFTAVSTFFLCFFGGGWCVVVGGGVWLSVVGGVLLLPAAPSGYHMAFRVLSEH
jgi:hypothetical protein